MQKREEKQGKKNRYVPKRTKKKRDVCRRLNTRQLCYSTHYISVPSYNNSNSPHDVFPDGYQSCEGECVLSQRHVGSGVHDITRARAHTQTHAHARTNIT
jgi:hypothetical protein